MINTVLIEHDEARRASLARLLETTGQYRILACPNIEQPTDDELGAAELALLSTGIQESIGRISSTFSTRSKTTIPIVILTDSAARSDLAETIEQCMHFEILAKPFASRDLLARMHAVMTEQRYRYETPFQVGEVEVIPATMRIAHQSGMIHPITNMQLRLLVCLLKARGVPMSRQDLLADVWGYAPNTTTGTIDTHIYQLRQKIETDPSNPTVIVYGNRGYFIEPSNGNVGQRIAHE